MIGTIRQHDRTIRWQLYQFGDRWQRCNRVSVVHLYDGIYDKFVEYQKATQKEMNKAHWQYVNGVLTRGLEDGDQKPFWRYIRSQRPDNQGVSPLKSGSQLCSDAFTYLLSKQFSSVFTHDTPDTANIQLQGPQYPPLQGATRSHRRVRVQVIDWRTSTQVKRQAQMKYLPGC